MTLKTKQVEVTKKDAERNLKKGITGVAGRMRIAPPKEEAEDMVKRTVIYRCMKRETKIMNPSFEEVRPTLQKLKDEVELCSRGYPFGMLEYLLKSGEEASAAAPNIMENEKWLFFLIYMGKRTFNIKVGAIPPVVKVDKILAAIFKEANDYKLVSVEVTKTVLY